jgi:hypothetical protein
MPQAPGREDMTPKQRSEAARKAINARWAKARKAKNKNGPKRPKEGN